MGYTHYWYQRRDLTESEWTSVVYNVGQIMATAKKHGVSLCNGLGEKGTEPSFNVEEIMFNGDESKDEDHETMVINRKCPPKEPWQSRRGFGFCKTARKPYDAVVVAVLIFLDTFGAHEISSDGDEAEWSDGLSLAMEALPTLVGELRVPEKVRDAA
jgi:hypothetical protein